MHSGSCGEDTLDKDLLRSLQGEGELAESSNCMYVEVRNESSEDPRQLPPGSAGMLQCFHQLRLCTPLHSRMKPCRQTPPC